MKLQTWLGFHGFFHWDSVCSRIQSRISHWVQLSCLLGLLHLWQFLCYFSRPWQFWRLLVGYFVECPSIWVCLMLFFFFTLLDWAYEFWGRILQRWSAFLTTSYQGVQWRQHDLPLVRLTLWASYFYSLVLHTFYVGSGSYKVAIPFRWGPLLCLLCVSSSQTEDSCCGPARSRKNTLGPYDSMSI